jgi:hypothetical protein
MRARMARTLGSVRAKAEQGQQGSVELQDPSRLSDELLDARNLIYITFKADKGLLITRPCVMRDISEVRSKVSV